MEPKIVDMPERTFVGIVHSAASVTEMSIGAQWSQFDRQRPAVKNAREGASYEIHIDDPTEPKTHYCFIGVEVQDVTDLPADMFVKIVPAGKFAVFTHKMGDGGFKGAYQRMGEWLRNSNYTEAQPFEIHAYDSRFKNMEDPGSEMDVYIPVKLR